MLMNSDLIFRALQRGRLAAGAFPSPYQGGSKVPASSRVKRVATDRWSGSNSK
jgi:hypothetical protein